MKSRILSIIIALPIFIFVIVKGGNYLFYSSIILGLWMLFELHRMIYKKHDVFLFGISALYLISTFITIRLDLNISNYLIAVFMFSILSITTVFKDKYELNNVCVFLVFSIYIITMLPYLYMLNELSIYFLILPFLSAWIYDTCAYLVGIKLGKNRPWKNLSPKKSIEGAAGGMFFSITTILIYGYFMNLNLIYLTIYAILAVVIAQIGDLLMSALKRFTEVKDSGKILPGHGGFLDRFDSVMPLFPLAYFFVTNYLT